MGFEEIDKTSIGPPHELSWIICILHLKVTLPQAFMQIE